MSEQYLLKANQRVLTPEGLGRIYGYYDTDYVRYTVELDNGEGTIFPEQFVNAVPEGFDPGEIKS